MPAYGDKRVRRNQLGLPIPGSTTNSHSVNAGEKIVETDAQFMITYDTYQDLETESEEPMPNSPFLERCKT